MDDNNQTNSQTDLKVNEKEIRQTFQLSKDFVAKENDAQLQVEAQNFVNALVNGSDTSNTKQEALFAIGAQEQQQVLDLGKQFNIRFKDLQTTEQGGEVVNIIEELSKKFDEINPGSVNWGNAPRKKLGKLLGNLPFIGNAVSNYWNKYQGVMTSINENIATLDTLLDSKEKEVILINAQKDEYLKLMKIYHDKIVMMGKIKGALEQTIENETDETKKRFMQENWLYPLNKVIMNHQELYLSSFDAAISAELVARGHRELISDLRGKNKVAMVRLQTGVNLAYNLHGQKQMLESMKALKETNQKLGDAVHNMLGQYQNEIHKEATESFQDFDQWKAHMEQTTQLYADAKQFRVNALPTLNDKINQFGTLMLAAETTADEIRQAAQHPQPFEGEKK